MKVSTILFIIGLGVVLGAPQGNPDDKRVPMPYNYEYEVNDPPSKSYFGHEEAQNEAGRTDGKYFVWLPDGRLMTVTYYVEGDSGFVPKISFSDANFNPPPPTHQLGDSTYYVFCWIKLPGVKLQLSRSGCCKFFIWEENCH
ncbi:unnamed protein product [Allacma fusca]|uniref:Uncharacterized protein n=1 Tax=Allacma fusca TaxID=39272 RepID=A0A8J2PT97_9HEXA|nr:unnamed protein product [Allacma fusca]